MHDRSCDAARTTVAVLCGVALGMAAPRPVAAQLQTVTPDAGETRSTPTSQPPQRAVRRENQPSSGETKEARTDTDWYGWQILLVDVLGIGTGIALSVTLRDRLDDPPPGYAMAGTVAYGVSAIGAPMVHYAHGRVGIGAADLGLRVLVPILTGSIGGAGACLGSDSFDSTCADIGLAGGAWVGMLGASALDALVLTQQRDVTGAEQGTYWYGWQMLLVDGLALSGGIALAATDPESDEGGPLGPALATWTPLYLVGLFSGPIVHFVHGRVGIGFLSFGIRALIGPMGALPGLVGYCVASDGNRGCPSVGAEWGLLGGTLAVALIDGFALAWEEEEEPAQRASWWPLLRVQSNAAILGVSRAW